MNQQDMVSLLMFITVYCFYVSQINSPLYLSGYVGGFTIVPVGECPLDPGGYFIVKGTEKVTGNIDSYAKCSFFSTLILMFLMLSAH